MENLLNEQVDHDEYGEVINSKKTYMGIGSALKVGNSVIIGWTDQEGTHCDINFMIYPLQAGPLQGGMKATTDLYVGVARKGMFGFELNGSWKSPGYIGDKLGLDGENDTTKALAELINGVCKELQS